MRRAARTDANHASVVQALRSCGWTVVDTSALGGGYPDLNAARGGRLELIEVKDGRKSPSKRKLTPDELRVHDAFKAAGVTVKIISSIDDAMSL